MYRCRFWWRDTRLSELDSFPPPPNAASSSPAGGQPTQYQFPHPTTFAPIPYHTNTSLGHLFSTLIPFTRTTRVIPVTVPTSSPSSADESAMELDSAPPAIQLRSVQAEVRSDGLLLYVAQAAYEPGTSPLSNWVPLRAYQTRAEEQEGGASVAESPLDVFERCVLSLGCDRPDGN